MLKRKALSLPHVSFSTVWQRQQHDSDDSDASSAQLDETTLLVARAVKQHLIQRS